MERIAGALWRKSSYSGSNGGACVEVAQNVRGVVAMRDSKNPAGFGLAFGPAQWTAFAAAIKSGEFDLP